MKVTIFRKDGSRSVIKRCFSFEDNLFIDVPDGKPFRRIYLFRYISNSVMPDNPEDIIISEYSVFNDEVEKIDIDPIDVHKKYID